MAAYRISKAVLNALTHIAADEVCRYSIEVNGVCPGRVRTEAGGPVASRAAAAGTKTVAWLATLPDDGPTNGLFRDRRSIAW